MPITRCKDQKHQTLKEFYAEAANSSDKLTSELGKVMLELIDRIDKTFLTTKIFGLTSHYRLFLLSSDNSESDWFVSVIGTGSSQYYIDFSVPKNISPWPNARITGETKSLEEAILYLVIAMSESGGWKDSAELQNLLMLQKEDKNANS